MATSAYMFMLTWSIDISATTHELYEVTSDLSGTTEELWIQVLMIAFSKGHSSLPALMLLKMFGSRRILYQAMNASFANRL